MPLLARHPFAVDRPGMPPGGSPATDAAYEDWLRPFVDEANSRWVDRHVRRHHRLPHRDLLRYWQMSNHLIKWSLGMAWPSGKGPNHIHRLRLISVQFSFRRESMIAEAERYIATLAEVAEADL